MSMGAANDVSMWRFLKRFKKEDNWVLYSTEIVKTEVVVKAYDLGLIEDLHGPKGSTYRLAVFLKPRGRLHFKKLCVRYPHRSTGSL